MAARLEVRPLSLAAFVAAVALVALLLVPSGSYATPYSIESCMMNRRFRVEDPSKCEFGWVRDACGNTLCTKGPGALCGGKHSRYGICGEGLLCSNCGRCTGCSTIAFDCFHDQHCIY